MKHFPGFALLPLCAAVLTTSAVQARNHPAAQALSGSLRPQGLTPKADPQGLKKLEEQLAKILSGMEQAQVSNGPGANDLLETAYEVFRPEVGPLHRNAAVGALTAAWTEARALGAFDEANRYTGKITKGADRGQQCILEYIVPMDQAPKFSRDVVNIRLVSPSRKRAEGALPTTREKAYVTTLSAVEREVEGKRALAAIEEGPKTNSVGQTKEEADALWKAQRDRDGDKALEMPSILLGSRMISTPSRRNNYRWVVQAELTNLSMFATEVEVEVIFLGTTDKQRKNYVMGEPRQKVRLRGGQAEKVIFQTPLNETDYKRRTDDFEMLTKAERIGSQTYYRGAVIRVHHAKGVAATFASDPVMLDLLKPEAKVKLDGLPKLYLDPKLWPKMSPGG